MVCKKGNAMPQCRSRCCPWRSVVFAVAVAIFACPAADAKDSTVSVKDAEQYVAKGNLKAAEIELRNEIREAPQDPAHHARPADAHLQLPKHTPTQREARDAPKRT